MAYVHGDAHHSVLGNIQMEDPPQILRRSGSIIVTKEAPI
jgi:hypothetical protein